MALARLDRHPMGPSINIEAPQRLGAGFSMRESCAEQRILLSAPAQEVFKVFHVLLAWARLDNESTNI